jgi:TolB-like protein/class 3 adenylate cyclase/uncharacterized protein (DUF924 family)
VSPTYQFGRFELIPATRQLLADGGAVTLGARAFDVLVALVERRERMVTKDELLEIAWPGLVVEENNLQVQISALRKALGPQAIATIPGKGYRFAARLGGDMPPAPERPADAPERRKEPRPWLVPSQSEGPRLAAVVFTDVVGYSARMQKDESGTIALVKADFERMRALCGKHGGESLNTMGDGLLLCFPSALQAVSCALQIQGEFGARKLTDSQALEHRIGLHLGDVFHLDTGDVAGDGINIASRLESKAPPGGICLSQTIYDTVKGKLPMRATFLGPETFKNIAEPVPIWQVTPEEVPGPAKSQTSMETAKTPAATTPPSPPHAMRWSYWIAGAAVVVAALGSSAVWFWSRPQAPPDKSIAVLPFANMSEDKNMAYFADGVQDDLLTQLALLGELKVVSRTSVAEFRNSSKNIRQIATELGVTSLVEGSVRRAGDRVRVSAQLIDARSDKHIWAQTYDRDLKDIFAIQSELATEIAKALKVSLSPAEEKRLAHKPTENLAAYDLYRRYQDLARRAHAVDAIEKLDERIELLERVVELDPKFALAWAILATEHARKYFYDLDRTEARLARARQAAERALALAPADLAVKAEVGNFYYYGLADYTRAVAYFEDLLRVAPNNVAVLTQLSWVKRRLGRWPEANALLERALAIDPRNVDALSVLRDNLQGFRHADEAIALQRRIIEVQPDSIEDRARLHAFEWTKSGSSAAYVAWRRTLPEKVARESFFVWDLDLRRALVEGDADTAIRILETPPAMGESGTRLAKTWRALLLLRKGERARAHELARSSLREAQAVLAQRPDDVRSLVQAMLSHAILDERQAAWDAYKRLRARLVATPDALDISGLATFRLYLYAALGDRDGAVRTLALHLKQQNPAQGDEYTDLYVFFFRGDPRVQALLKDPANNAPLPIVNWDLEKMLAELAPPKAP